jgi:HD-like signal output (HDOD) protein
MSPNVNAKPRVLLANSSAPELAVQRNALDESFDVAVVNKPELPAPLPAGTNAIIIDQNISPYEGIDLLMSSLAVIDGPVIMLIAPSNPKAAVEAKRAGASLYLVKVPGYATLLAHGVSEAIKDYAERAATKQTIASLRVRVSDTERSTVRQPTPGPGVVGNAGQSTFIKVMSKHLREGTVTLPVYPEIGKQFRELISTEYSLDEIADLLRRDAAITARLLALANSPYYRRSRQLTRLSDAISLLGRDVTRRTVDMAINQSLFAARNERYRTRFEDLWRHSMICAHAAEILGVRKAIENPAEMFTLGLLHDIGSLCITFGAMELEYLETFRPAFVDRELAGGIKESHCMFGRLLLKRWAFPTEFLDIAQHHEDPTAATEVTDPLKIVHFADRIANWIEPSEQSISSEELLGHADAAFFEITKDTIEKLREDLANALELAGVQVGATAEW